MKHWNTHSEHCGLTAEQNTCQHSGIDIALVFFREKNKAKKTK